MVAEIVGRRPLLESGEGVCPKDSGPIVSDLPITLESFPESRCNYLSLTLV